MLLSFLLTLFVQSARDKIKFCQSDDECRPGYYCEMDVPCNWPGHCLGDPCETCKDCDGDLICYKNQCALYEKTPWEEPSPMSSPAPAPVPSPAPGPGGIPITTGNKATLTYFDDNTFECIGQTTPPEFSLAVNPLLLGYTADFYANLNGATPPWCGKTMTFSVNGKVFIGTVIDTCNPLDSPTFPDPVTGEPIGGKCGYDDVIDLYGEVGRNFLIENVGDDFFQGNVDWILTD